MNPYKLNNIFISKFPATNSRLNGRNGALVQALLKLLLHISCFEAKYARKVFSSERNWVITKVLQTKRA